MIFATLLSATLLAAPPPTAPKTAMRGAFDSLTTLIWLTSGPLTPEQTADVKRELSALEKVPHALKGAQLTREPGLGAVSSLFAQYVTQTRTRLEFGDRDAVRYRVRTLASLCFACHSREQVPADFSDAEQRFSQLRLSPLERARVLAATRQFDLALTSYRQVLDGPPDHPDFARALEESLVVLVRVKGDAAATLTLLDAVTKLPLREPQRVLVSSWRTDVKAWQAEPKRLEELQREELVKACSALVASRGDVPLLRASAALTRALPLDASKCAERFEERLTLGFTGSSGTHIPPDEQRRLDELRALAGKK